jgi:cellulose synthase/poly-beta-1,6-N-acetylglucosamine synthase-like glycosyltransferase
MASFLEFVVVHWLLALGLMSAALLGAVCLYAVDALRRKRRYFAAVVVLALVAVSFTWPGIWLVSAVCGVIVVVQATCYLYFSARSLMRRKVTPPTPTDGLPSVTVIVAARDEAAVIDTTLRALDAVDYPPELFEVVVIDDGSSDDTYALAAAVQQRARHRMRIQHYGSSGGKARRLNEVTDQVGSDLLLFLDADHQVEPDLVRRMVALFGGKPDVACVQVASSPRNVDQNILTKLAEMAHLFPCHASHRGKSVAMFVGSGGMVRRAALREIGGFHPDMLVEDLEMSYRLYRAGYRVVYEDSLRTRDLAADSFRGFFVQRHRWMSGLWQAMAYHRHETEARVPLGLVRAYYVQLSLDGIGALCLCALMMYFALAVLGLITFPATALITYALVSYVISFSVGCLRGGQPGKLLYMPLAAVYIIAYAIPASWALVDRFLLAKPLSWVKTERRVAPAEEMPGS